MSSEWRRDPTFNPRGFGGLTARLNRIEQQIRALAGRAGINNATMTGVMRVLGSILVQGGNIVISAGGMIIDGLGRIDIMNGGSIAVRDRQSRDVFYAGGFAGEGFGIAAYRLDGSIALILVDDDPTQELVQRLKLLDRTGKFLLAEDPSGNGISWPPPPLPFVGMSWPTWDGNDSGTFVTIAKCVLYKETPRFILATRFIGDAGTSGEVRLLANGTQVGAVAPVAPLTLGANAFGTPVNLPGNIGDPVTLELQTRRTAGTGLVRGRVEWAFGWASA